MTKKRVAIYLRVSTQKQAQQDISIPDQRKQAHEHCKANGWVVCKEYIEAGRSATNDRRPTFQNMVSDACSKDHPFDIILVYSFSRFFRDAVDSGIYRRKLEKHDVTVSSITQDFGDGHDGELLKNIIAAVDEHASKENGKNTLSRMIENAKQGFWNGARPPYGYRLKSAEIRGDKTKKKLEINHKEAEVVRKIYSLYLRGEKGSGSLGIKAIATWLNSRGYHTRTGKKFYLSSIHKILTHHTYQGEHYFNTTEAKTRKAKPRDEWVMMKCPAIVSKKEFSQAQKLLKQKAQNVTPSRLQTGCTLLAGLMKCAKCQSNYMLSTSGKGKQYRYYKPAKKMISGDRSCNCKNYPMQELDNLIMSEIGNRMLKPDSIKSIISELSNNHNHRSEDLKNSIKLLNKELGEAEKRLNNLYDTLAEGKVQNFDSLNDFIRKENLRKRDLELKINAQQRQLGQVYVLSNTQLERLSKKMREALLNGPVEFRKHRLTDFVDRIEIDEGLIHIHASKRILVESLMDMKKGGSGKVRTSVREWHPITETDKNFNIVIKIPNKK